ncbi:MAG: hypothetical protein B6I26_04585 [Desulfobacteraceae bacterium 4572_130]|nr:MAG: hypothetical protein B6I26_04585 [Desulfobacteraceae bacterium 4572_130]
MDWNWFFSALSQSTAAIVGIFGAFIVTKILSNQTTFTTKREKTNDLLSKSKRLIDDAKSLSFEWYIKGTSIKEYIKLHKLWDEDDALSAEEYYEKLNFSRYVCREIVVNEITKKIEKWELKRRKEREANKHNLIMPTASRIASLPASIAIPDRLNKEADKINLVLRNIKSQSRDIKNHLDTIANNPESSSQITYALLLITLLFFVGVIYPISFLPMPSDGEVVLSLGVDVIILILTSFKGVLLLVVSLIFCLILAMFLFVNIRMKYDINDIKDLETFTKEETYSKYFETMVANRKRREENNG